MPPCHAERLPARLSPIPVTDRSRRGSLRPRTVTDLRSIPAELALADLVWLRALALRLVRDEHAADDAVQEAFLRALQAAPRRLRGPRLRAWLATVLRNAVRRGRRDAAVRREHEERRAQEAPLAAADPLERLRVRHELASHVLALPEPYRTALLLRYQEGLSHAEVGARQGVSEAAARQRVARALARLRERLDAQHGGGRGAWALALVSVERFSQPAPALAPAATLGGILMATKAQAVAVAAVCAVAAVGVWMGARWGASERPRADAHVEVAPAASLVAPDAGDAAPPPASALEAGRVASAAAPPPVAADPFAAIDRERDLHGLVLDPQGAPVGGARVALLRDPLRTYGTLLVGFDDPGATIAEVRTEASGAFVFPLEPGEPVDLVVEAAGFARARREGRLPGERVVVQLSCGAALEGRVTDDLGAPVAHARIELTSERGGHVLLASATTDEEGRFALADLEPGDVDVAVRAPSYATSDLRRSVELSAGATARLDLELSRGAVATGRVVDAETELPVAGARVEQRWGASSVRTGADGRYELRGIDASASSVLAVEAVGYAATEERLPAGVDGQYELDFALRRGVRVHGRVVGAAGEPVAGASVTLVGAELAPELQRLAWRPVATAADGSFAIEDARVDLPHVLRVVARGHAGGLWDLPSPESGAREVDVGTLALAPSVLLCGTVVLPDGEPVPHCDVWIQPNPSARGALGAPPRRTAGSFAADRNGRTDDLGRFAFAGLAPGAAVVRVQPPGGGWITREVAVPSDVGRVDLRVELDLGLGIVGRLVDPGGSPVPNAWVRVDAQDGAAGYAFGDAEGRFRLASLPPGAYRLIATPTDAPADDGTVLAPATLASVSPGTAPLEIVLPRIAATGGVVVDALGRGLANVPVVALAAGGERLARATTDESGSFFLRARSSETFAVRAELAREGAEPAVATVEAVREGDAALRLVLPVRVE